MSCFFPLKGYMSAQVNKNGKKVIVFDKSLAGDIPEEISVACGQCSGCRLDRSKMWAIRCVHEASMYDKNCFITLTFNDDNLNSLCSLDKRDFVNFMKRLRKAFPDDKIKFFHCGEYGSLDERPHHHACLFNFDFDDKYFFNVKDGVNLYRSDTLEKLWPFGFCTIGDVTYKSAAYVARYVMKKITGDAAPDYYQGREPEYITMSRGGRVKGGIGKAWFDKYGKDLYPDDFIVHSLGKKIRIPRYYDNEFNLTNPVLLGKLKEKRKSMAIQLKSDNTPSRLKVKRDVLSSRIQKLRRDL